MNNTLFEQLKGALAAICLLYNIPPTSEVYKDFKKIKAEENTVNFNTLESFYQIAIDKVTKDFNANVADTFSVLNRLPGECLHPFLKNKFSLPIDCIKINKIVDINGNEAEYEIKYDNEHKIIISDKEQGMISYLRQITNVDVFSSDIKHYISACLAMLTAYLITNDMFRLNECIEYYETQIYLYNAREYNDYTGLL